MRGPVKHTIRERVSDRLEIVEIVQDYQSALCSRSLSIVPYSIHMTPMREDYEWWNEGLIKSEFRLELRTNIVTSYGGRRG